MKQKKRVLHAKKEVQDEFVLCKLPEVPERKLDDFIDPNRLSLIRYSEKKWVNFTQLHYFFLENRPEWIGSQTQKDAVRDAFIRWKELGIGLIFEEVQDASAAEIRIGFEPGGSWSYVGRDCVDLITDPSKRTMNFGWDLTTPHGRDTALHEIGHALGFPHEHQNPNAGIVWNEEAVYNYFRGYPNYWPRDQTFYNVIRKISSAEVDGSLWDKDSIMHYSFQQGLISVPIEYVNQPLIPEHDLSEVDIREVKKFYPAAEDTQEKELKPFLSQIIDIQPGEQLDFIIEPDRTRNYTIQTFGEMDTVMVLFQEINGQPAYVDGDDDSGFGYNSKLSVRLLKDSRYFLRIRLYYSTSGGYGGVMLW